MNKVTDRGYLVGSGSLEEEEQRKERGGEATDHFARKHDLI